MIPEECTLSDAHAIVKCLSVSNVDLLSVIDRAFYNATSLKLSQISSFIAESKKTIKFYVILGYDCCFGKLTRR